MYGRDELVKFMSVWGAYGEQDVLVLKDPESSAGLPEMPAKVQLFKHIHFSMLDERRFSAGIQWEPGKPLWAPQDFETTLHPREFFQTGRVA
jgi:hypothetical protein